MKQPARIAFLSEHASPLALLGSVDAGGQNVYVDEVSRNLANLGYAVDVFTRATNPDLPAVVHGHPGVRVVHLPAGPRQFLPKDQLWPLMPAFVQAFLAFMSYTGLRYDLLHGNFWMSGWVGLELQRCLNIPLVQIFHAMGKNRRRHQHAADTSPPERVAIELAVVRQADRLIAQCPTEQRELEADYAADPQKIAVIPSAVNIERFRPVPRAEARRTIGLAADLPTIVYVGRMLPRKDIRNIVRAVAILTHQIDLPVQLLIVGGETAEPDPVTTPEIGVLQHLAAELNISDRIHFYGKRQPDQLRNFYCAGDVAVTTPWYEPFGLTPLEGMACGRPVIGAAVGGITFTIQDGITGRLVPPRDPAALAAALHHLLTQPKRCAEMGQAARARVEREFTWPTVARRTAALYQTLLADYMQREDVRREREVGTAGGPQNPLATASTLPSRGIPVRSTDKA